MKLRIDVVTLFPQAIEPYLETAILGKAQEKGIVKIKILICVALLWIVMEQ